MVLPASRLAFAGACCAVAAGACCVVPVVGLAAAGAAAGVVGWGAAGAAGCAAGGWEHAANARLAAAHANVWSACLRVTPRPHPSCVITPFLHPRVRDHG